MNKRETKKAKKRYTSVNYLLSKPAYLGDKNIPTSIELIQYDSIRVEVKPVPAQSSIKDLIDKTKINWFKVIGISDAAQINRICIELGLHGFDVKDLLLDQQVVKIVAYDKITFVLLSSFYQKDNRMNLDDMQVAFILGENFIVSFQEELLPIFDEVKSEIEENNVLIRKKGADFLLYILLSAVNLGNINTLTAIEDKLTSIEDQLIKQNGSVNILQFLHICRIDYTRINRSVTALREEFINLQHNTNKLVKEENVIYFNGFEDRLRTTLGYISSFHETLSSLLDLYYNNNNMKMNEIIKRLTIVSTIFIPLTFMVGVWGMNFKFMPELDWRYGYIFSWASLVIIAVLTYLWIRKQKWF
ncbi:MAG: magnesium and cobalt transport protein CorA [Prevotella sp.]|jgi:magnesium transporter|nr:magnesium and cobalt transport protein CorA [Prevotella sp.]